MANASSDNNIPVQSQDMTKKKGRKKKEKKKHPVLFFILVVFFCLCIAAVLSVGVVAGVMFNYVNNTVYGECLTDLDYYKSNQNETSIMYAYNDSKDLVELCRLHGEENRIWVDYDKMPENLLWAYVCLEDKRFYQHRGVDWYRTIACIVAYDFSQGGSTLTQQLIKNLTNQKDVTFVRKFTEILKALNFEYYYSKKDIIEAYLNTVPLGEGCYGVKTAAETYFGKEVQDLSLAECAMFAGITQAPYSYNPRVNMKLAKERQKKCLDCMLEQGKITQKQYNKALKYKIKLSDGRKVSDDGEETVTKSVQSFYEDYVVSQVISDLQEKYDYEYSEAWRMVYYGGLKIYSAVDIDVQNTLDAVFKDKIDFPYAYASYKDGSYPQASMTIMDYKGRIVALSGGTGEKKENLSYNRATDSRAKRQPGSSIKPLTVYGPAIDMGIISSDSLILNQALNYNGETWPKNVDGTYGNGKYVTVKEGITQSINTVAAHIVYEMLGVANSFRYGNEIFHLHLSEDDLDLSPLACGGMTYGVTSLEMAQAYATFGNGGRYYKGYSYYKVLDKNGQVLLDNTKNEYEQAIQESTASTMLSLLENVVANGTGTAAQIYGFETFGKTGSTTDYCDRWFCGGTPHYVASVWYGHDYPVSMTSDYGNQAAKVFYAVMSRVHDDLPSKSFNDVLEEMD